MAYQPGIYTTRNSAASGRYVPAEYENQHQPRSSSYSRPEANGISPRQAYNPPRPEMYQSNSSYQPATDGLHAHIDPPLPIGDHVLPASRRASSSRPRLSTDSRPRSDSHRSHRSHHSGHSSHSPHEDADRGRRSHDGHRHGEHSRHEAVSGDRSSARSRRSHHSHYSLKHHFDDDVGRLEPPVEPLKRRDTRRPTLGGSVVSLYEAAKKSLGF